MRTVTQRAMAISALASILAGAAPAAAQGEPPAEVPAEDAPPEARDTAPEGEVGPAPAEAATSPGGDVPAETEGAIGAEDDDDFPDPFAREPVPMVIPDYDQEQPRSPFGPVDRERYRWIWNDLLAARINPLGLMNQFRTGLRVQLSNEPGILWEESYAAILLNTMVSPAFGRVGARLELAPITAIKFAATYDFFGTFGLFNSLQTFDTPAATYDDETLEGLRDGNEVVGGGALELEALVQAKLGPVAVRNNVKGYNYRVNRSTDLVFYDTIHDNLHPNGGWGIQNDLDLLWIFDFGLKLGGRYTYNQVFYPDRFAVEGTAAEENTPIQRVGPAALFTFFEDPVGVGWNKPTVGVLAQWWVQHRYRTGQDISQGIPYILIIVMQEGDFLP